MFQTAGYPQHAPYFDYRSPPRTPTTPGGQQPYYSPRHFVYTATPPRGHTRRATQDYAYTSSHTTPRKSAHYAQPEHFSEAYRTSAQSTPQRKSDYVSRSERLRREDTARHHHRRYTACGEYGSGSRDARPSPDYGGRSRSGKQYYSSPRTNPQQQQQPYAFGVGGGDYFYYGGSDEEYEYLPRYEPREPCPPPSYRRYQSRYEEPRTDRRSCPQVPIYTAAEPTPKSSRPRRASYTTSKPAPPQPTPNRRPNTATNKPPPPPVATAEHARRAGIPAGYSYKNWDPTEEPILLLGSVFDANSLGKWIYDWTVFYFGPGTPLSEVAGELWLLLIQLAGKIKRAEECMPRIRRTASRDLVDDFLESGERLWQRFNKLLKICEGFMWRAAKKEQAATREKVTMGRSSGCEFVDAIFGRDRELPRTEKLMTGMRLWSMRFDANCEEILRNPGL